MYIEYRVYIIIYRNVYVINFQNYIQIQKKKEISTKELSLSQTFKSEFDNLIL